MEPGTRSVRYQCSGLTAFATSHCIMDGRANSLVMTVHLLAKCGHALPLQQALSQLQEWICLDVRLFIVSERTSPIKYYETYRQKSSRFPGTSVLLFLHEDLGKERIFQVHDFFQRPPWQRVHLENGSRKLSAHVLDGQDFYGLDEHMPVWGLRQVHYGTEILRVTLYCSFDNYADAVRLYETILQQEAIAQKSSFCAFVLHMTESIAVQLCLKQLPLGIGVDSKESSVLQFKVRDIGQLVPLLPNPCIPISSTRWQTEDYEGNKILFQVPGTSIHTGNPDSSSSWPSPEHQEGPHRYPCTPSPLAIRKTAVQPRNRTVRAMKNKSKSSREVAYVAGSICSPSPSNACSSSLSYSPAGSSLQDSGPSQANLATNLRPPSHELWPCQREEEETNVDTGNKVIFPECRDSPLSRFSQDIQQALLRSQASCGLLTGSDGTASLPSEGRDHLLSSHITKRNKGPGQVPSSFPSGAPRTSRGNGKDEEEEFFI